MVPQGSKLGPFFFLIYINDKDTSSGDSNVTVFPDKTTLNTGRNKKHFLIQKHVESNSGWLAKSKLSLNVEQCQLLFFGFGKPEKLKMRDKLLEYKKSGRYLSVHVDKWFWFN